VSNWYDEVGKRYTNLRIQDRRIARHIHEALRNAETVANIGVGTGSYEPLECEVLAIEPSALMLNQYTGAGKRVQGIAEALPFGDNFVEASMGILTLHHWRNWKKGLKKMLALVNNRQSYLPTSLTSTISGCSTTSRQSMKSIRRYSHPSKNLLQVRLLALVSYPYRLFF
jgi:hypothetical protein